MTIEKIRKNAPAGATHYRYGSDGEIIYYKNQRNSMSVYIGFWAVSSLSYDHQDLKPL